jgi:transposase-like protein
MPTDPVDSLPELIERFGTEDKCHEYIEQLRWPEGITCPRCDGTTISRIKSRRQYDCDGCRYQFSVRVGTVLQDSKLPLWKWFLATYLMVVSKKGISANQLKGMVGVSYKTAWYLCHRIRSAMEQDATKLTGTVEVDETFVGGKKRGKRHGIGTGWPGRDKTMIVGAIQRGGPVKFRIESRSDRKTLHKFIEDHVDDDTEFIYTDGHLGYRGIGDDNTTHEIVDHGDEEWVRGDVHTNTVENVWSPLKRSIIGSYHQLSAKHLPAYLDEIAFRFNNRENPFLFRDTMRAILASDVLGYKELVKDRHAHTP